MTIIPQVSRHLRAIEILEHLEVVRNWLHEAPIDELEAVEKALQRNAPITEINEAITLMTTATAELFQETKAP